MRRIDNPPNPFASSAQVWLEEPPRVALEVFEEEARSIVSENDSPDLPFRYSLNPYRGCAHGCAYCYARPTHEYLGFGAGTDFDSKIVVKVNAEALLRKKLASSRWHREPIAFSGVTDCYQPLEAAYELTRDCLQACVEFRNPVRIVTKSFLIVRDAELLGRLARRASCRVAMSMAFADRETVRALEPATPVPSRRFQAITELSHHGVEVGVMVAPIIPGWNDREIPEILERAHEAGATFATMMALRLPGNVESVFLQRLRERLPLRYERVVRRIQEIRGGSMSESGFFARNRGEGAYWKSIEGLFTVHARRLGLRTGAPVAKEASADSRSRRTSASSRRPPAAKGVQGLLPFAKKRSRPS